jgi:hypothetical protein
MTSENIMITMEDVDVVRQVNPAFHRELVIAATARVRAENNIRLQRPDNQNGTTEKVLNESSEIS